MTDKPFVSVVIPLYNKEKIIAQSLKSVLDQTYTNFEIVVVDDGSTDKSVEVVKNIGDDRIQLLCQPNAGPSKARNTGVKNSNGDWIVFLDADDELLPEALSIFTEIIVEHQDMDIIDCNRYVRRGEDERLGFHPLEGYVKNPFKECYYGLVSPGEGRAAFRKTLLLKHPYHEKIRRFEDAELIIRLLSDAKVYSSRKATMIVNCDFSAASHPRKDVMEDYFAYLDFSKGGFWRKMCVYRTFLEERELYPEFGKSHYAKMYKRYDWLLMYKLLNWFGKYFK